MIDNERDQVEDLQERPRWVWWPYALFGLLVALLMGLLFVACAGGVVERVLRGVVGPML